MTFAKLLIFCFYRCPPLGRTTKKLFDPIGSKCWLRPLRVSKNCLTKKRHVFEARCLLVVPPFGENYQKIDNWNALLYETT